MYDDDSFSRWIQLEYRKLWHELTQLADRKDLHTLPESHPLRRQFHEVCLRYSAFKSKFKIPLGAHDSLIQPHNPPKGSEFH